MEAAQPLHKGSSNPHGPGKKQKPEKPVVIPLPVTEVANLQTRNPESTAVTAGSANPYSNRMNLNGTIAPVHGSRTIYDKGAEIRYNKFQESLAQTGDLNHPDTQKLEKSYIATLSISQIRDYRNLKNGTYLPKTLEEQAAAYQAGKSSSEAEVPAASGSDAPVEISPVVDIAAESGTDEGFALPEMQEDAVRTTPTSSNSDPNFNHTVGLVKTTAKAKRAHAPKEKAEIHANAAAAVPAGERKSQAKGRQVEQLDQQRTGSFSASGFKVKLRDKIKSINLPAKQGDAENFKNRNNINAVNGLIKHDVMVSKNSVTGGIETVARQQPDETKVALRTATALPDPKIGSKVSIRATEAMPPKRGDSELSQPIAKSYKSVEQQFAKNHITDEQLAKSNEPDFINALNAKKAAKAHAEQAPGEFKNAESKKLEASKREAQGRTNSTMDGMHQSRKGLLDSVTNKQHKAGEKNTAKHQEVVDKLNAIYAETKKTVDGQLGDLETKVAQLFDDGAKKAKDAFEKEVTQKLEAYKARRYGEWYDVRGYGNRIEDAWNKKLPDEVDKYYKQGKDHFMTAMDGVITKIAELVTTRLNAAKASITAGRQQVVSFVKNLPADVKKAIKGDIDAIQGQFKELENSISDKESSLIDSLATKYNNALKEVDELIVDIKKRNRGFLAAVEDATVGVAKTIMEIRKTLTELLSGAVSAVMAIVADPIGFLSNLIAGVSQGITNFGTNIWTHLKNGFFGWLTGAMKNISFTLPEDLFSLKGIFSMSSQILGLTWNDIRSIGSSVVGEPVMKVLETGSEKGLEAVQVVRKEGAAGLWEHVKDQFADIKATVMDTIMDIIKTQAIQAGIRFIMSLLTPAGAFVKAAMMIIDLVKFFVQKAAQIMELVKAFTDGIKAITSGNVGAVAKAIENALGRAIPVVIGFLASLAGLGGLADKVVGVIQKIRQRIKNAIVKFWNFVKGKAKGLLRKIGVGKKDKEYGKDGSTEIDRKEADNGEVDSFKTIKVEFEDEANKYTHHAYYRGKDLIIESTPTRIEHLFINKNSEARETNNEELLKNLNLAKSYYFKVVKPKEEALREADLEDTKNSKASISRQKKAKGFDDNRDFKVDLEKELRHFSQKYLKKLFTIESSEYPLPRLPIMSDNVKAHSFVADYLNDEIADGSEASKHTGNLEGWSELTGQRLREPAKWVRMHLLPHQLGGNAVDSNLTPALGTINKKFSKGLELDAINLAKKGPKQDRRVIWYKFNIEYYNGNVFPKFLFASYGTYSRVGKDWKRNSPIKEFHISPDYPEIEFQAFDMKANNWDAKEMAKTLSITQAFANALKQNGGYSSIRDLRIKLSSKIDMDINRNKENLAVIVRADDNNLITF